MLQLGQQKRPPGLRDQRRQPSQGVGGIDLALEAIPRAGGKLKEERMLVNAKKKVHLDARVPDFERRKSFEIKTTG